MTLLERIPVLKSLLNVRICILLFVVPALLLSSVFLGLYHYTDSYRARVVSLQDKMASMKAEKADLQRNIDRLQKELDHANGKNAQLEKELSLVRNEQAELENRLKAAETEKTVGGTASGDTAAAGTKTAYLTFDDGPSGNTGRILEILKKYNVKATFFVTGRSKMTDKYKEILAEGHVIGNHTYTHDYSVIYSSSKGFFDDFDRLNTLLWESCSYVTDICRLPGGSDNMVSRKYGDPGVMKEILKALKEKGYKYFDWNVTAADSDISGKETPKDRIVSNILSGARHLKKAIVLMHDADTKNTTVEALPKVIEGLSKQGFTFNVLTKDVTY